MKKLLCLLGFVFCLWSCGEVCQVEGKMNDFSDDVPVYLLRRTGEFTYDTVGQTRMVNGLFKLDIPQELWGEQYELKFGDKRSSVSFFAEAGKIVVEGSEKAIYNSMVKGTPENDRWNSYYRFMMEQGKRRNQLMREISASNEPDSVKRIEFMELSQKTDQELNHYKDSLTQANPGSVVALYVHYQILPMLKYDQIDDILQHFAPYLSDNRYFKEMKAQADILRRIAPGVMAPDFKVKTVTGEDVSLSSFRGKYLILDFWASWCAPCREETVFIKELYDKYHDKGLEVFSVSLDDKQDLWTKAIQDDKMNWNHGCQLLKGGRNTPVAQLYGIDGIPAIWVIDPTGKILAQGLQGERLVEFCSQLFN